MKQFLLWIFVFMISFTVQAQIKPMAMLLPIYFVDLDKKSLQGSLNNFVKTELSNYYDLKSEKEVEQARDAAVDQISSENCTEEACVKVMGELLDVEYTFSLEIIDTGEGWDLSVVRQGMDGVTSRRNELCNDCSLSKARKSLAGILTALRPGEMLIQRGKASLRLESTPRSQVYLDGREQGETPLDLSVNARVPLEIFMVAEGYNDFAEEFNLKPGEKRKKHAKLTRKRGNIRITSNLPKASIYVDGVLEMDAQGKALLTPADLRLVYGQHELKLQLEKYEVATETLRINKKNLGTRNITLQPKPGRLIVRVPSVHKEATIRRNGNFLGKMNGKIVKNFEVLANISLTLKAEDGNFLSETITVRIEPDGSEKVEFEDFTETVKKPIKKLFEFPKFDDMKFSDLYGENISLNNSVNSYNVILANRIKLGYTLVSLGLNWKNIQIVFSSTAIGEDSIKESTTNESVDSFYYSDGNETREVVSTNASFTRITYSPNLDEFGTKYVKNRNPENSWIWGAGLEFSNVTLKTRNDGERKISASSPLIEGGYQWNWGNIGGMTGIFINLQIHLIISASTRVQFVSSSSTVGYIF